MKSGTINLACLHRHRLEKYDKQPSIHDRKSSTAAIVLGLILKCSTTLYKKNCIEVSDQRTMAAGGTVCRYNPAESSQKNAEARPGEAGSLHERLVAYVHALEHGARRGVWREHSYARARLAGERAAAARRSRVLLAPRRPDPAPPDALIDVDSPPSPPPSPPGECAAAPDPPDDDDPAAADDWEARLAASAPSPVHARLADAALGALCRMRLARLASGPRHAREDACEAAWSLRRALAPAWLAPGAPAAWLHGALAAHLPRAYRRHYDEVLAELHRSVPRLAARLAAGALPPPARPLPAAAPGPPVGPAADPWLVWVSSGCAALDARWERRLAALVHTRVLRAPAAWAGAPAPPDAWCAAAAGAVRERLTDALAEAGDRSIILGGIGLGASLCLLLARGAGGAGGAAGGVRGAVLVAPALRTAEGGGAGPGTAGRGGREDALHACRLPLLLVVGTRQPDAARSIANDVCEAGAGSRRLVLVSGADAALRLPRALRRRLNLPQHALDAALAEECVRWALERAEGDSPPPSPPPAPAPAAAPAPAHHASRRHPLNTILHQIDVEGTDEEYAHLPQPLPPPASTQNARSIEIVEGRVVSRAAGGTPLPLLAPRRSAPASPAPAPAPAAPLAPEPTAADIMQMPIVFADDNATDSSSPGIASPVTVTSGKRGSGGTPPVKMTRVIVAKRGAGASLTVRPPRPALAPAPGPGPGVRVRVCGPTPAPAAAAPRRLLVRRGMRIISRRNNE